jgi:molybdopterin-guanine dinucleotide biosynthesis protein A
MPHLDPRILTLLLEHGESELVVPKWRNGYLEPLCSLYSKTQAPILREMMDGGVLKISRLFQKVERSEFPVIDDWIEEGLISKDCFLNMNEMLDYRD